MSRLVRVLLLLLALASLANFPVQAQSDDPPVYVVQPGDTLIGIAFRFAISADDLIAVNQISDPNNLQPGVQLILPGIEGVHGALTTRPVALGETLRGISRRYQTPVSTLVRLNHLTSPGELYAGTTLIMPEEGDLPQMTGQSLLPAGATLLEQAALLNTGVWTLLAQNDFAAGWQALPGDTLYYPSERSETSGLIDASISGVEIQSLPLIQGKTIEISVKTNQPVELSGSLAGYPLRFVGVAENSFVALTGIYALADPGLYPILLNGKRADGSTFNFEQLVRLESGNYIHDPNLVVDPATIDPAVTRPENDQIARITQPFTPERYWQGVFLSPGYDPKWITSWFGNRRTYNQDPSVSFHTGLDYGGGIGLPIKAPAAGVVVFAGPLTVRGNATIIDHGWGVYSGFWHQSKIEVTVGEKVQPGQEIGLIGGTGRVTGAHLHWEVWVNGVQVDPLDWLEKEYP